MKYILFEATRIANIIRCDNCKVNQNISSKRDIWVDFEFIHNDFIETYSIANNGYVYYSVQLKNRFFIIHDLVVSHNYIKWIKRIRLNNVYIDFLYNIFICMDKYIKNIIDKKQVKL